MLGRVYDAPRFRLQAAWERKRTDVKYAVATLIQSLLVAALSGYLHARFLKDEGSGGLFLIYLEVQIGSRDFVSRNQLSWDLATVQP